jgi:hypothetical protein
MPVTQFCPSVQTVPHAPQLLSSLLRFTHRLPQYASPALHVHSPAVQNEPPPHVLPHAPQLN